MVKAGGKYLRYSRPVRGRGFVAPNFSRGTFSFMRAAGKLYLRLGEGVASVRLERPELLVDAYRQFFTDGCASTALCHQQNSA